MAFAALTGVLAPRGRREDTSHDQRTRPSDSESIAGLDPTGDVVAQRRAWEELATVYNEDLPAIGGLEKNVELRSGLRADVAVPKGAGPHPVVIYLHGGGWAFGSPTSHRKLGMQFAEAGYLTIVLDYRLAPSIRSRRHWKTRCSRLGGRLTTRADGTAMAGGSRSAAIPRAATWRSAPLPRALLSCARWCERQCSSTVHTISRRPPSATERCPGCKSN